MIPLLLSLAPILLLISLLLILRKPLFIAAPISFLYALLIAVSTWAVRQEYVFASLFKAFFVSFDIILIIFGAILFLEYLKSSGLIKKIEARFSSISSDMRGQAIIIIWFFGSFIEGTAGFGSPAAITAPFLVAIGFPALLAVILALVGNSTAVVFGAVGTPIRIGFVGLDVSSVSVVAAFINLFAGLLVPLLIIGVMTYYQKKPFKYFSEAIPFALWSGLCFLIPYFLLSFLGPEFPSLLGPIIGLFIVSFSVKKNLFVPKRGGVKKSVRVKSSFFDFSPYFILIGLLLAGKYVLPSLSVNIVQGVSHSLSFYNPGFLFLLSIVLSSVFFVRFNDFKLKFNKTFSLLLYPFISIFFITSLVQLLILSGYNNSNLGSMLDVIISSLLNNNYLLFSPLIGAFGSFLSGSATVSNLLFGALQFESALILGLSTVLILALQVVGAGIGNMVSLTNIVAAQATVKLKNEENSILKGTIVPALIYLVFVTIFGLILSSFL
jgi:lactate permease